MKSDRRKSEGLPLNPPMRSKALMCLLPLALPAGLPGEERGGEEREGPEGSAEKAPREAWLQVPPPSSPCIVPPWRISRFLGGRVVN